MKTKTAASKVDGIRYRTAYNDDHALALGLRDCDNPSPPPITAPGSHWTFP